MANKQFFMPYDTDESDCEQNSDFVDKSGSGEKGAVRVCEKEKDAHNLGLGVTGFKGLKA